jgi:hypothetical protein
LSFLRYIKLLSLGLWVGSFFFFAVVVAPALFTILPSRQLAGMVVTRSLNNLHWIGMACGLIFLLCSVLLALLHGGSAPFHPRDLLLVAMMTITLSAHYGIERHMNTLRTEMGFIDQVPHDDPRRVEFNRMHVWSTRMESSVFVLGLVLFFLEVRAQTANQRRTY